MQSVEQRLGLERGPDPHRRVEEVGLVEDLADRLGLVERGDRLDLDAVLAQQLDRRPQVAGAVADVGAEAEVAGRAAQPELVAPSSSSSSSARSWVTSTATSLTDSGSGGSGFAARTRTDSQPKRSISRSPTTWQSRSRVL